MRRWHWKASCKIALPRFDRLLRLAQFPCDGLERHGERLHVDCVQPLVKGATKGVALADHIARRNIAGHAPSIEDFRQHVAAIAGRREPHGQSLSLTAGDQTRRITADRIESCTSNEKYGIGVAVPAHGVD